MLTAKEAIKRARQYCANIGVAPNGVAMANYCVIQQDQLGEEAAGAPYWQVSYQLPDGTQGATINVLAANGAITRFVAFSSDVSYSRTTSKHADRDNAFQVARRSLQYSGLPPEYKSISFAGTEFGLDNEKLYSFVVQRTCYGLPVIGDRAEFIVDANAGVLQVMEAQYHGAPPTHLVFQLSPNEAIEDANKELAALNVGGLSVVSACKAIASPNSKWQKQPSGPNRAVWAIVYKRANSKNEVEIVCVDASSGLVIGGL